MLIANKISLSFCLLLLLVMPKSALSWGKQGHLIVAMIAYNHLTVPAKKKVDRLIYSLSPKKKPGTGFIEASTWADDIRYKNINRYNHWHYIHKPSIQDGIMPPALSIPNIISASKDQISILTDLNATQAQQAFALRMLIHLLGDLHQPLHVCTLYSTSFKQGDLNGLRYKIKSRYKNLHHFWDVGGGLLIFRKNKGKRRIDLVNRLESQFVFTPLSEGIDLNKAIDLWQDSAFEIAQNQAYKQKYNKKISQQYRLAVRELSQMQLFKAGQNLASILNRIYH